MYSFFFRLPFVFLILSFILFPLSLCPLCVAPPSFISFFGPQTYNWLFEENLNLSRYVEKCPSIVCRMSAVEVPCCDLTTIFSYISKIGTVKAFVCYICIGMRGLKKDRTIELGMNAAGVRFLRIENITNENVWKRSR